MATTNIGTAIRRMRGLHTQQEFADTLGVSRVTVARWESGDVVPSLTHARLLISHGLAESIADAAYLPTAAHEVA